MADRQHRIFGVMIVRDAVDVVRISLLHHLALGCERILVIDNGSTDGSTDVLRRLGQKTRISWSRETGPFDQEALANQLVADARTAGADWVVPIDADEFWWSSTPFRALLEATTAGALLCDVVNFVQHRNRTRSSPRGLLDMTYRPVATVPEDVERRTDEGSIGFVQIHYPPKAVFRPGEHVHLLAGAHGVLHADGPVESSDELVVLHAPLRSRETLAMRAEHGRRLSDAGVPQEVGWHWRRWSDVLVDDASLEREWRRNSQLDGALDLDGIRVPLVEDTRLRDVAKRWATAPSKQRQATATGTTR